MGDINGNIRLTATATAASPVPYLLIPSHMGDVTLYAKGGGAGNKVQQSCSSAEDVAAGTAEWFDVAGLETVTNAAFDADHTVAVGARTVTAYRVSRDDADTTLVVLGKIR